MVETAGAVSSGCGGGGALSLAPGFVMRPSKASAATLGQRPCRSGQGGKGACRRPPGLADDHAALGLAWKRQAGGRQVHGGNRHRDQVSRGSARRDQPKGPLEAVSKTGSFDIALPATFGIPDLAESGILVNMDQYASKYEPDGFPGRRAVLDRRLLQGQPLRLSDRWRYLCHVLQQGLARQCRREQGLCRQARL